MPTRCLSRLLFLLPLLAGCCSLPTRTVSRLPRQSACGIVIVLDGAGGRQYAPLAITNEVDVNDGMIQAISRLNVPAFMHQRKPERINPVETQ